MINGLAGTTIAELYLLYGIAHKKLAAKGQALKMGDPMDPQSQIGCMINAGALERVVGLRRIRANVH